MKHTIASNYQNIKALNFDNIKNSVITGSVKDP